MFEEADSFTYEEGDDFDFEEFEDDEDIGSGMNYHNDNLDFVVESTKNKKKVYEVDFKTLDLSSMESLQLKEVESVSNILGLPHEISFSLLRAHRWNKEKLIELIMDSPSKTYESSGLSYFTDSKLQPAFKKLKEFSCPICCNDEPEQETLQLPCGDIYCLDCHRRYLDQKIMEGNARSLMCPGSCKTIILDSVIKKVISKDMFEKYINLMNTYFVDDNKNLKWCPAPDCNFAVQCDVPLSSLGSVIPSVQCQCGHFFCFGCNIGEHMPGTCPIMKLWIKKCEDDSETANWIHANTKECPKCASTIEKNGGCNHMTCRKCRNEFCWVCMGLWSNHGQAWYDCNRYSDKESSEARDKQAHSRANLERYLHYHNRYANHLLSAKLDQQLYARTEAKMDEMQKSSELTWIEVQFLKAAVDILVESRHTLRWTYALAYYLQSDNQTYIFESNQQDLELATEALSGLLEEPIERETIPELKQKVQDKANYVSQRRDILLADTIQGHSEGRWKYRIDI